MTRINCVTGQKKSPTITARVKNKFTKTYQDVIDALIDTGAGISVVHENLLKLIESNVVTGFQNRSFVDASGKKMGSGKFVSLELLMPSNKIMKIDKALVIDNPNVPANQILIGTPEIDKYGMILNFESDQITSKKLNLTLTMSKKTSKYAVNSMIPVSRSTQEYEKLIKKHGVTKEEIDQNPKDFEKEIDGREAYKKEMRAEHERRAKENTASQVIFDEDFCQENPGLKEEVQKILQEYPDVFKNVVGKVPDIYQIYPTFTEEIKSKSRIKMREKSEIENKAIKKKLDLEFQDGILVFPEDYGITVTNQIPLIPVQKRDDDGELIPKDQGMRVVANCKLEINRKTTQFAAMEVDNLGQMLRAAARASKNKFKAKFDIASAFFQIGLTQKAWKHMGVEHPDWGQMVYTRLPQGWLPSFGWCTNVFKKVFGRCTDYCYRYMDDCYFSAPTKALFLVRLRKLLDICRHNGITLKGSKMRMFEVKMNFLGHVIKDGKIMPSTHRLLRAQEFTIENLRTSADLRKFLGIGTFLARHLRRSSVVFSHLRKIAGKDGKYVIPWKENDGFLEKEFLKSKSALKELCTLTPYDETKQAFILVDSSKQGVGAILYQKHDGINQVVEFYSRKRPDAERKFRVGSCILELAGMTGALHYWRKYLEDSKWPVIVFTDSKSLEALAKRYANNIIPSENKAINSFFANLSGLRVKVVHLPGKSVTISGVDCISRDELPECVAPECDVCKIASTPMNEPCIFVNKIAALNEALEKTYSENQEDEYFSHNLADEENLEKAIIYRKTGNPFECNQIIYPVKAVQESHREKLTLDELKRTHWLIRDAQMQEPHFKRARICLEKNELPGPKEFRAQTLINTKKSFLENRIIKYQRWIGQDVFTVIPIPGSFAIKALAAIHLQFGCMSPAQLLAHFRRHFDCPGAKQLAYEFGKNCTKCVLLRKDNLRQKPDVKIIQPPSKIGEIIYVDELSRRDRKGKELKLLFATEGLSRFGMIQAYSGTLTSDDFIKFMTQARTILAPLHRSNMNVIVRTDGASAHSSHATIKTLKNLGLIVEIYESGTRSKNIIPEHDSRCAILSKFLNISMQEKGFTTEQACNWAILQYNTSLTNLNWSPAEIFANRQLDSQTPLQLTNQDLKDRVMQNREKARKTVQERNERKKLKKKLQLVPYKNPNLNEPEVNQALWKNGQVAMKVHDIVKLNVPFDKNDYNRLYRVMSIDWEKQTFQAQKLNTKGKTFNFKFDIIDEVVHDYIRFLSCETFKKDKLLLLAWGAGCLETKLESDFSITSRSENDTEKIFNDSGKPASPLEYEQQISPQEPSLLQPTQVQIIPDPRFVPTTPSTPGDLTQESTNLDQTVEPKNESTFYSCAEESNDTIIDPSSKIRDSDLDTVLDPTLKPKDQELDETIQTQGEIMSKTIPRKNNFKPSITSSPKKIAVESKHDKPVRQAKDKAIVQMKGMR